LEFEILGKNGALRKRNFREIKAIPVLDESVIQPAGFFVFLVK
jgi:hypothetical protein